MVCDPNIREATAEDSENISSLVYQLSEKYITCEFTPQGSEALLATMRPAAIRKCMENGFQYHVAEMGALLTGVVGVKDNSHLYHLFVAETHHRQGIARKLWQVAKNACLLNGNPGVFTVNSSSYALRVYENLGFKTQSEPEDKNGVIYTPMKLTIDRQIYS